MAAVAAMDINERMKKFLLNNDRVSRVAFGTTLDRELLPLKPPNTRAGNEMGLRGVPNLAPGSYDNDASTFVHLLNMKPVCKKGYSLGARTDQRFPKAPNPDFPGPPSHQAIISKPRQFATARKPFQSGDSRFPQLQRPDTTPGAGCYEHDTTRNRKVQFHGSFGGAQILKSPVTSICRNGEEPDICGQCNTVPVGDFFLNKQTAALCRPCHANMKNACQGDKDQKKRLEKYFKVRDCSDRHEHEGTNAKLRIATKKDLNKIKKNEAYLSLYYE